MEFMYVHTPYWPNYKVISLIKVENSQMPYIQSLLGSLLPCN